MDDTLRNGLWNALQIFFWGRFKSEHYLYTNHLKVSNLESLFEAYWYLFFKAPLDTLPKIFNQALQIVRNRFYLFKWNEIYDFLEFTLKHSPFDSNTHFVEFCNRILEMENSAYRFVGGAITEITSDTEIQSIEEAMSSVAPLRGVNEHLKLALDHLSDRQNPDYRNSIKESISAVEAICQLISGDRKAELGKALAMLEKNNSLHGALKKSFSALYGYTSDADGIRHAMLEESNLTFTDAKYMLVACTAFINYLLGKAAELGINIEKSA